MIITVSLNPAIDKTVYVNQFIPGGLNRVSETREDPGGKGINVSKILSLFGIENIAFGVIAGSNGEKLAESCRAIGLTTAFIRVPGETRTNLKVVDSSSSLTTEINEPGPALSEEDLEMIFEKLFSLVKENDTVVFTGSLPKGAGEDLYYTWSEKLYDQKHAKIILDASGRPLIKGIDAPIYAVKPNLTELEQLTGHSLHNMEEILSAGELLHRKGVKKTIVSLGSDGAVFILNGNKYFAEALQVPVKSTVGAGDSMVAALLSCEEKGAGEEESIRTMMAAASAAVMCAGTDIPPLRSILSLSGSVKITKL